jgi:HAD superfamily hydrolase (TIGR01549 family)
LIEAVVFDLDGTLVHLPIDYERLFEEFRRIMQVDDVHPLLEVVSKVDAATRGQVFKAWEKAERVASANLTVNQDGMKLYEEFAEKPKALVTMQGRTVVNAVLNRLGLAFDVTVTREDSLNRAEQLEVTVKKLGLLVENVVFVGNTDVDSAAAVKVGCQFLKVKQT